MQDWRVLAWLLGLMAAAVVACGIYWTHQVTKLPRDCVLRSGDC